MDSNARHWYLQQMGIPVWVPKGSENAAGVDAQQNDSAPVEHNVVTTPQGQSQSKAPPEPRPEAQKEAQPASNLSPAKAIAEGLRAQQSVDATADNQEVTLWLVMPNVPSNQRADAEALLEKVLNAVSVPDNRCLKLWATPDALPPRHIQHVWCFGIEPPPGLAAKTLFLPPIGEMLTNNEAKRFAWQTLKAAMPFV